MSSSETWVLPATTTPADTTIERRHTPEGPYEAYRDCLRWDFGFTCAFCLLHETDLAPLGVEGLALAWVEHARLKSNDGARDEYANCHFACRMCNQARGRRPSVDDEGAVLLDPAAVPWGAHFERDADELLPRTGDRDARYTWLAYNLDDARKVDARRCRREEIDEGWEALEIATRDLAALDAALDAARGTGRMALVDRRREVSVQLGIARRQLLRHRAVPLDPPEACACDAADARTLAAHVRNSCRAL
jgi:hypothetical protein